MKLIYITSNPEHASVVDAAGVDRVMVDLEINGKVARQGHLDTIISHHKKEDINAVREQINQSELVVRVNPLSEGSTAEVEDCLARGAQRLMLPMFERPDEVCRFIDLVAGRVPVTLLMETPAALVRARWFAELVGSEADFHIGLNDLHLACGLDFMFELLSEGVISEAVNAFKENKIAFGIGGIARLGMNHHLSAELVLSALLKYGAETVFLSRDYRSLFEKNELSYAKKAWTMAIDQLHDFAVNKSRASERELDGDVKQMRDVVRKFVSQKKISKQILDSRALANKV